MESACCLTTCPVLPSIAADRRLIHVVYSLMDFWWSHTPDSNWHSNDANLAGGCRECSSGFLTLL